MKIDLLAPALDQGTLTLIGLGVRLPHQLTLESLACLEKADVVFCLEPENFYDGHLRGWEEKFINLNSLFKEYPLRNDALVEAARRAVIAARDREGVVFAFGGHPAFAVAPYVDIIALAQEFQISVRTLAGVSSAATFFAELGFDPLDRGIQLVRGRAAHQLSSRLATVIVCPGYSVDCEPGNRLRELAKLARELCTVYGSSARFLVFSAQWEGGTRMYEVAARDIAAEIRPVRLGRVMVAGPVEMIPSMTSSGVVAGSNSADMMTHIREAGT